MAGAARPRRRAGEKVAVERARVESEGWGARLLALRDPDGQWAGGACFPRYVADNWRAGIQPDFSHGQPWTSTLPTLMLLRDLGLDPACKAARETTALVAENCRWEHDGQAFFDGEVEPCINGRTLSIGAYFGADVDGLVRGLLADQLDDGGWNCEAENGATVSSFDSVICVLEGLLEYELARGAVPVAAARRRGEEYLLERQLFRRKTTGEVPAERWLQFSWPPRWHYDVLRALDYFRRTGDAPDERVAEAVQLVRDKRQPDGTWPLENTHPGETHFEFEDGDGRPSRWNTLRALRVLDWYDQRRVTHSFETRVRQPGTRVIRRLAVGPVGLLADAEAEEGRVARPRAAERFQVCPRKARGREADAVAEQHRQHIHQDLVDEPPLQALAGHVGAEDFEVLAARSVQCGGDRFPDVAGEDRDLRVRRLQRSMGEEEHRSGEGVVVAARLLGLHPVAYLPGPPADEHGAGGRGDLREIVRCHEVGEGATTAPVHRVAGTRDEAVKRHTPVHDYLAAHFTAAILGSSPHGWRFLS